MDWSTKVRYLGVIIDKEQKFASHVHKVVQNSKEAKFNLYLLINKHSPLILTTKLHIYKANETIRYTLAIISHKKIFPKRLD